MNLCIQIKFLDIFKALAQSLLELLFSIKMKTINLKFNIFTRDYFQSKLANLSIS